MRQAARTAAPALLAISLLASCGQGSKIYRDSWGPDERDRGIPSRLLWAAVLLRSDGDLDVLNRAGATLIGWHDATDRWALRAGSTGGTHFAPVLPPAQVRRGCYSWGDTPLCSAGKKARYWSRVAVFRLSPDRWHALPAHLIPTDGDLATGTVASAVRAGCQGVHPQYGSVRCAVGWRVVANPAVAAKMPPLGYEATGPDGTDPRGPVADESDAEFEKP